MDTRENNFAPSFDNDLSPAQLERLALLIEEASEVIHIAAKIQRHGRHSRHPDTGVGNVELLERELGDLQFAIRLMMRRGDVSAGAIEGHAFTKRERVKPFLHHNTV